MADSVFSSQTTPEVQVDQGKLRRDLAVRRFGQVGLVIMPLINYFFLWAPIAVLIAFSFNDAASVSTWRGFTTRWYEGIFAAGAGGGSFSDTEVA